MLQGVLVSAFLSGPSAGDQETGEVGLQMPLVVRLSH